MFNNTELACQCLIQDGRRNGVYPTSFRQCGSRTGARLYMISGNIGQVKMIMCGEHYQNSRRWHRKSVREIK